MAKLDNEGVRAVLDAASHWRDKCLFREGSVFNESELWTKENFEALKRAYVDNPIDDSTRRFYDKLREQLGDYPAPIKQLMAELVWVVLLFPSRIRGEKKREDVRTIWSWSGKHLPENHPLMMLPLEHGVGHAGTAFNTHRWREVRFFCELMCLWHRLTRVERDRLLADPWEFAGWIDESTPSVNRALRHVLLFLLFPEQFERIAITRHRRAIVFAFSRLLGNELDVRDVRKLPLVQLDKKILEIRRKLEAQNVGAEIDFYRPPISGTFELKFPPRPGGSKGGSGKTPNDVDANDPESSEAVVRMFTDDSANARLALEVFAEAVVLASTDAPGKWAVTITRYRIGLNVGRCIIAAIRRGRFDLAVMKPVVEAAHPAQLDLLKGIPSEPYSVVAGLTYFKIGERQLQGAVPVLRIGLKSAIQVAGKTARRAMGFKNHAEGVLKYLEKALGHNLPDAENQPPEIGVTPAAVEVATPIAGFRATELDLEALLSDIHNGDIALPDIQRPFVWTATKVRDLFDSMYRGYPVGYLLFWEATSDRVSSRAIGIEDKPFKTPKRLIVDGQQRLTSLFAVRYGQTVVDDDFRETKIEIAFRPRDGRFEVADAAVRRDPEFIPNISTLLDADRGAYTVIHDFVTTLAGKREVTERDREIIGRNLDRLFGLKRYRFSVLEISADLPEEAVADIFVRINSQGVKLNQADFILTLLSVIWEQGRSQLEEFSRSAKNPATQGAKPTPFNHLFLPSPDQLLRVSIAVGFNRARLGSVYQLLRGKDPDTGDMVPERRVENLKALQAAQSRVLDLNNWHRFINAITAAGFRLRDQVSSENALLVAYAIYLRGLSINDLDSAELDRVVGLWFAMATLTSRFSAESDMEEDLASIAKASNRSDFLEVLGNQVEISLTNDYWNLTLSQELETSNTRGAGWAMFVAAQLLLNAPVLFSDKRLWNLLDPLVHGHRRSFEAHHIFPKAWLAAQGITDKKEVNQIANLAFLEWPENMRVGAQDPAEYVPQLRARFDDAVWERMCRLHALPLGFETMGYEEFLEERRVLMARIIQMAFLVLADPAESPKDEFGAGSVAEAGVWKSIAALESELRRLVRALYARQWAERADSEILKIFGEAGRELIERNRAKYLRQYKFSLPPHGSEILDFVYLGQLAQLMTVGSAWQLFQKPFKDKRQLEELIAAVQPVRNDAAHFRTVPPRELERCRLAVADLRTLIGRIT